MSDHADAGIPAADAGHALVEVAAAHGTSTFFGVVSIHNQPLVDRAATDATFVPVRHEAAAVNAADASARVTGRLGVAITSTGTGAGNAAGSLIEALTAGSPVLHVTGQIDAAFVGEGRGVIHETKDQRAMLEAISKRTLSPATAEDVGPALAEGAAVAVEAPAGPVSVEIPIDLQYRPTAVPELPARLSPAPDQDRIDEAVALLAAAERPLLWLGGGAVVARAEIGELVARTGAGVVTSNAGRGTIDERDRSVVGNFGAAPDAGPLWAEADLLLSIGTHFRSNETRHYRLELPRPHVQIDVDPAAIGRVHPADVGVIGAAADIVGRIVAGLDRLDSRDDRPRAGWCDRVEATRQAVRDQLRADIGPYAVLCDAIRAALAETSPLVRDVTIPASAWGNRLLDVYAPDTNVNPRGGGIGQGAAMALGASLARPDVPTLLMVGDGGLAVHLGELASIAQERPWVVTLLFNDGGYGVLRNLQDHHFGRRAGVDLVNPDFAALAASFSIAHRPLADPADSAAVLTEAVGLRAPVIVEVDCDAFGEMPKPFVPPVPVQRGD